MPKPKQQVEPQPEKPSEAPAVVPDAAPKPRLDVAVEATEIPAKRWPDIRVGTCEFCGVMDKKLQGWEQYKLCPHYKGIEVRCIYCPLGADMEDVIKGRTIKIRERLNADGTPSGILTMWCSDMKCETAHYNRFAAHRRIT